MSEIISTLLPRACHKNKKLSMGNWVAGMARFSVHSWLTIKYKLCQ
jgi:hypothetical protein